MASEGASWGREVDRSKSRINAVGSLNNELESLVPSLFMRDTFKEVVGKHVMGMLEMNAAEANNLVRWLEEKYYIPSDREIDDDVESAVDLLRSGLFMDFIEEYAILFETEDFNQWAEPFIAAMLRGHIPQSESLEHIEKCVAGAFCPTIVAGNYMADQITENPATIESNKLYLSHTDEIINMNVTVVRTLQKLEVYSREEAAEILEDYKWWIESMTWHNEPFALAYDRTIFETNNR